ncbi:MAG: ester cyclase [Candidatus Dormibacteraceae bacterium]
MATESHRNKEIVARFIEEVLNAGALATVDELFGPDFVSHGWRATDTGRDAVKQFAAGQRVEAPDWRITIHEIVAEKDRVAVRATGSGIRTVANEMVGQELVGRKVAIDWIAIYRIAEGRIAERWVVTSPALAID